MHKAINMQADVQMAGGEDAVRAALQSAFAAANPGMKLTIKGAAPGKSPGTTHVRVYIEGDQEPAAPFAQLAGDALHKAIAALGSDSKAIAGHGCHGCNGCLIEAASSKP